MFLTYAKYVAQVNDSTYTVFWNKSKTIKGLTQ